MKILSPIPLTFIVWQRARLNDETVDSLVRFRVEPVWLPIVRANATTRFSPREMQNHE